MTANREKNILLLSEHLPEGTAEGIWYFIEHHRVSFRIAKSRKSKLGDYRPPYGEKGHRISVNHDLNPYAFLITVLHEFAHLLTWNEHRNRKAPHGHEWKAEFKELLRPYMEQDVFPGDVKMALEQYMINPAASSCVDMNLSKSLNTYDLIQKIILEDLPDGSTFSLKNGLVFEKGTKLRKRYKCKCLTNDRMYYVSAIAEVRPVKAQTSLF